MDTELIPWDEVEDLLIDALCTEGAHHKQWYLWRLAELLSVDVSNVNADDGVAP